MNPNPADERRLLVSLWMQHQKTVGSFVWTAIGDLHDSEDVLQQVAEAVAEHFDRYEREKPFLPWVMAIARNKVTDHYRREGRNRLRLSTGSLEQLCEVTQDLQEELSERAEALELCLRKLGRKARQMLDLRYGHDLSPKRIAEKLGTTANSVSATLSRIRSSLAECINTRLAASGADHGTR